MVFPAQYGLRHPGCLKPSPSSPTLFLYLQSCRYRNPGEYIHVFPLDGPKLRFGYYPHLAPKGEGSEWRSIRQAQAGGKSYRHMAPFTIKVLTYNIHKGFDIYNRQFVLHLIREQLQAVNVDVVFLQEIHGRHERHENRVDGWPTVSQFEYLADQVWTHYAYGRNAIYNAGHHGNAILSKYPFEKWQNINVSPWRRASRSLLHGVIQDPQSGRRLDVICVHLGLIGLERSRQFRILGKYIDENIGVDAPLVLAGDFNDWSGRLGRRLETDLALQEAFQVSHGHYARTYPAHWPLLQMDRIYFRGLQLSDCKCFGGPPWKRLSDHAPLYAQFEL